MNYVISTLIKNISYYSVFPSLIYLVLYVFSYCKSAKENSSEDKINQCTDKKFVIHLNLIPNDDYLNLSYFLKQRISILVICTMISQIFVEFFRYNSDIWFLICWVFKISIWIFSIFVFKREILQKKAHNSYRNGLFWLTSFLYDAIFLLLNYEITFQNKILLIIIMFIRLTLELLLIIYGFFKIDDKKCSRNIATKFLFKLENSKIIQFLLCFKSSRNEENASKLIELDDFDSFPSPLIIYHENIFNNSSQMNKLTIKIDKAVCVKNEKIENNEGNFTLTIKAQTETKQKITYISEKTLKELRIFFNSITNSKIDDDIECFFEQDLHNTDVLFEFISKLEGKLQALVDESLINLKNSNYINNFLNIKENNTITNDHKPPLYRRVKLNDFSPIMKLKKIETTSTRRKTKEWINFDISELGEVNSSLLKIFFFQIVPFNFKINLSTKNVEYYFKITNLTSSTDSSWIIIKTYTCFKKLNEDLENSIDSKIKLFDNLVPKAANFKTSMEPEFLDRRMQGLTVYLENIIKKTNFHGEILYNFLNFDNEKGNTNTPKHIYFPNNQSALLKNNSAKLSCFKEQTKLMHIFEERQEVSKSSGVFKMKRKQSVDTLCKYILNIYILFELGENRKKTVIGINFNLVRIKLKAFKVAAIFNHYAQNKEEIVSYYFVNLEELFDNSDIIRTQIKIVKEYKDFLAFNSIINQLPCNFGCDEINLPINFKLDEKLDFTRMKKQWDEYLEIIRNLPRIEENQSFKEFFCLHRLKNNFQYQREPEEIIDFTN